MPETILTPDQIKYLRKLVLTNTIASIIGISPTKPRDDVFYCYVGHDPYNSADDHAFMDKVIRKKGKRNVR